ncbi:Hypothetical Protein FCC1311_108752 [Hondaea fermentalgiana]|uniref:Uncharacterized protein n=1 Tax=Hondaea fermentalgiana TaxID=2315210 RepID=A0A2R5H0R5_9STRA|nr:Hypothetical Protein FCC1311_108752 [Hondaea fermentalgiana]|eukprot:GBG34653.1 Hypothetical Protein FCC1311_108752 [Hondaea fermentalgiana]
MYSAARLHERRPRRRALGRVTVFPSAFGAGEDVRQRDTRPSATVDADGVTLVEVHSGDRYASVSDFVEAACTDYVRQLNGIGGSGLLEAAERFGREQRDLREQLEQEQDEAEEAGNTLDDVAEASPSDVSGDARTKHLFSIESDFIPEFDDEDADVADESWTQDSKVDCDDDDHVDGKDASGRNSINRRQVKGVLDNWDDGVPAL